MDGQIMEIPISIPTNCPQCGQFPEDHDDLACHFQYDPKTNKWYPGGYDGYPGGYDGE